MPADAAASDASGGDAAVADAGSGIDAAPFVCDFRDPRPPGAEVLWPSQLSATGADTLGGHGHDDSYGPVGFCPGTPQAGMPFYRLIAAGFETDTDITGDGDQADFLPVDFWRDPNNFSGYGESAGRVKDRGTRPVLARACP